MKTTHCVNCGELKPLWSTHKLCPTCRKNNKPATEAKIINARGQVVEIRKSNTVIVLSRNRKQCNVARGWTVAGMYKNDGALANYSKTVYLNSRSTNTPERVMQVISCESVHLAMYSLGLGIENIKFDEMKLHSWKTYDEALEEYDGVAIKQFGLRAEDN